MNRLRAGTAVDIVLEGGRIKQSFIQDYDERHVVLLQTTPPLGHDYLKKTIAVTFTTGVKKKTRYRFNARIIEFREGYVTVGRGFPAIIAEVVSDVESRDTSKTGR